MDQIDQIVSAFSIEQWLAMLSAGVAVVVVITIVIQRDWP